ncbi:hypothetical protein CANINC_003117 [Pichia inconspicua]|uniref:Rrp15p-domain-containing protein n=1 Tax=Pichia inconspicua TaxID=52247 RepID=A0A4T0X0J1_9ASCO|nr:hypothetical protein CANINC_003117 [[Candida] inconspicua]
MKAVQKSSKSRQEDKLVKSKEQMEGKVSDPMSKSKESESEESESDVESRSSASDDDIENEEEGEVDSNDDDDDDDDIPVPQKKQKVSKKEETEKFSNAMNALLDTHLKAYDRKDPILARSKKELKTFENEKLEEKAKRMLLAEKKKRLTANRVKDLLPTDDGKAREVLEKEKKLKKIAQKGVIKLFNAILMTQTATEQDISRESGIGSNKRKELVNEISKEKFLSLVQQAGK